MGSVGHHDVTDARSEAKAEAAAAKARAKAMRPWYRRKRWWLVAIVVVIVISIAASSSSSDNNSKPGKGSGTHPAADDVTVKSCSKTAIGTSEVGLEVVNHSTKTSNYLINITVLDPSGTRVGEANTALNNVAAGQTARDTAVGSITGDPPSISCTVADVTRLAS